MSRVISKSKESTTTRSPSVCCTDKSYEGRVSREGVTNSRYGRSSLGTCPVRPKGFLTLRRGKSNWGTSGPRNKKSISLCWSVTRILFQSHHLSNLGNYSREVGLDIQVDNLGKTVDSEEKRSTQRESDPFLSP